MCPKPMIEPTETESKERLDYVADVFRFLYDLAHEDPEYFADAPYSLSVSQPDERKQPVTSNSFDFDELEEGEEEGKGQEDA